MSELVVLVPTRGRPDAAVELAKVFEETCTADTQLILVVDDDDPKLDEYMERLEPRLLGIVDDPRNMVHALNRAAGFLAMQEPAPFAIGFQGDDHRPRTIGWDAKYLEVLHEIGTGIVYGDDLLMHEKLPTQCAMTTDIIQTLTYMAPPNLRHMYVDNWWRDLASAAGCLAYLPDVVVEHLHPLAEKGVWDEGYLRVNSPKTFAADKEAYQFYLEERWDHDLTLLKELCDGAKASTSAPDA